MKSGILPINKPEGMSSARVVAIIKKKLKAGKVGHTGTLDPFATGLLLCAVNQGTRISSFFLGGDKRYRARIEFGVETDTYDRTGQVVQKAGRTVMDSLDTESVSQVVYSFVGIQNQVAPAYSALKHQGKPLYKLARQGKPVQKPPRQIEIFDLRVRSIELPFIDIDVHCSSGTYIRSLAHDMGKKIGCGAHLSDLCRTGSGRFSLEQALDLEAVENGKTDQIEKQIIGLSESLDFLPKIDVGPDVALKIGYGQPLTINEIGKMPGISNHQPIRLVDETNNLLAIINSGRGGQTYNYSCVFLS